MCPRPLVIFFHAYYGRVEHSLHRCIKLPSKLPSINGSGETMRNFLSRCDLMPVPCIVSERERSGRLNVGGERYLTGEGI